MIRVNPTTKMMRRLFISTVLFVTCMMFDAQLLVFAQEDACALEDGSGGGANCQQGTPQPADPTRSWTDEVGDKFRDFLQEKVFGQLTMKSAKDTEFLTVLHDEWSQDSPNQASKNQEEENPFTKLLDRIQQMSGSSATTKANTKTSTSGSNDLITSLLRRVQELNQEDQSIIGREFWDLMKASLDRALEQMHATFHHITDTLDASILLSMMYFLVQEDSLKNPSWKRKQHRFYEPIQASAILQLHDALYLSQLAYVNSVDEFRKGLSSFQDNQWELAYGTTDSLPDLPAHFMLIHKTLGPLGTPELESILPWEERKKAELTVVLVVRGTKHLSDALTDLILEPAEYRNGLAHSGILENGKNLAAKYLPKLESLLRHSRRETVRLYLVGHSLGAGAAAIAAMEFQEHPFVQVEALGFGCPSLLSAELSESVKDYVTTVVSDSDIIPRMSGSSIANFLLDLIEFDWTDMALEDLAFTIDRARRTTSLGKLLPATETILEWTQSQIDKDVKPKFQNVTKRERMTNLLIPPGDCIHLYRDGVGYSAVHTPCSDFTSVEFSRTLIDDHLVMPGYHRAMITLMRDWENDFYVSSPPSVSNA